MEPNGGRQQLGRGAVRAPESIEPLSFDPYEARYVPMSAPALTPPALAARIAQSIKQAQANLPSERDWSGGRGYDGRLHTSQGVGSAVDHLRALAEQVVERDQPQGRVLSPSRRLS